MAYRYKKLKLSDGSTADEHRIVAGAIDAGFNVIVHHKDENKRNNDPANLEIMSRSLHCKLHGFGTAIRPTSQTQFAPDESGKAKCRRCKVVKDWSEFTANRTWSHGKTSLCLKCWREVKAVYRANKIARDGRKTH